MVTNDLLSKDIFLDTAPLIYFIEGSSSYQSLLNKLFVAADNGKLALQTSSITLLEVLVKPLKEGQLQIVQQYKNILLGARGIVIHEISNGIAIRAAELRAKYNLKTPDAIQLATCLQNGADYFLTNDLRLKMVREIPILVLEDLMEK